MHQLAFVVIPDGEDPEAAVTALMGEYADDGWWDWWQIGGRWTGIADRYDPSADPDNQEPCFLCDSTGMRMDEVAVEYRAKHPDYTCNGCDGSGLAVKHSTAWKRHYGDVTTKAALGERTPYTVVTADSTCHRERWTGEKFVDTSDEISVLWASVPETARVVIVDYHW